MKKSLIYLLFFVTLSAFPVQGEISHSMESKIHQLAEEIKQLKHELFVTKDAVDFFNLTESQGMEKVNTNVGPLYLRVEKAEPTSGGYKAEVFIGNPLYTEFSEITLNVAWKTAHAWVKKQFNVHKKLPPSTWISTEILIFPIDSLEVLKTVMMGIEVNKISLKN